MYSYKEVSIGNEFYTAVIVSYITVTFLVSKDLGQLAQVSQGFSVAKHHKKHWFLINSNLVSDTKCLCGSMKKVMDI